jgi:uncharacterized repeat protein (TIGR01451 family)
VRFRPFPPSATRTSTKHDSTHRSIGASRHRVTVGVLLLGAILGFPVQADYVGSLVNRIFVDPASVPVIQDGIQNGDEISYILETTPADTGSDEGHAAWMTVYIPAGVEVIGAELVLPAGNGGYDWIPAEDTDDTYDGWGSRGSKNYSPTSGAAQLADGYINEVQQDTGIFFSTDPRTRVLVRTPLGADPTGVSAQSIFNVWDYDQTLAYGVAGALSGNGGTGNSPLLGTGCTGDDGIGCSWTGTGSIVAGADAYYSNDYLPNRDFWSVVTAVASDGEGSGTLLPKIVADDYVTSDPGGTARELDRDQYVEVQAWDTTAAANPTVVEIWAQLEEDLDETFSGSIAFQLDTGTGWSPDRCAQTVTVGAPAESVIGYYSCDLHNLGVDTAAELDALDVRVIARGGAAATDGFVVDHVTLRVEYPSTFINQIVQIGPWQRIAYENSKLGGSNSPSKCDPADEIAGTCPPAFLGDPTTIVPAYETGPIRNTSLPTAAGWDFGTQGALPAATNAVRFVHGARRLGDLETARITLRVTDQVAFTDSFRNDTFCLDSTGGDTSDTAGKDVPWRYYEPQHECSFVGASGNLFKQIRYVNGELSNGGSLSKNDVIGYEITFTNTSGGPLTDLILSDTPDTTDLHLLEPGTDPLCPYPTYDGDLPGPVYSAGSAAAGTAQWATIPSLGAGESFTVVLCAKVTGGGVNDRIDNTATISLLLPDATPVLLTSTAGGTISTLISGHVYADPDASGNLTAGDAGVAGVEVALFADANKDGLPDSPTPVATAVTLSDGSYSFAGIPGGDYVLVEANPAGWTSTGDTDVPLGTCGTNGCDIIGTITVASGGASTGNDFFDQPPATDINTIAGTTFLDIDQDGFYEPGEGGQGGITIELYRDNDGDGQVGLGDTLLQTTVSAADGTYLFTIVEEGDFLVVSDTSTFPPGQTLTTDNVETATFVGFGNSDSGNDFGLAGGVGTTGGVCFAVANSVDELTAFTIATGSFTDIGPTGTIAIEAIAYQFGTNILYAADGGTFGTLDQSSGAFTAIGTFGSCTLPDATVINVTDVDGLSFDPFTGVLWGSHRDVDGAPDDVLVRIDPATGQVAADCVRIGSIAAVGLPDIDDIAISPIDQTMYAIANNGGAGDRLVIVDTVTGLVTDVGPTGVADIEGLGFANDGTMYATDGDGAPNGQLYTIDPSSGNATAIFTFPVYGDYESVDCMTAGANLILDGTVFADQNQNGVHEPGEGEIGQQGVTVYLYRDVNNDGLVDTGDVLIQTTVTDANGDYDFTLGTDGSFVITTDFPDTYPTGAVLTTDNVEEADFTGFNQTDTGNDFGFIIPGTLEIEKVSDTGGATVAGETITYTLSPRAPSPNPLTNVEVRDAIPADTSLVSASPIQDSGPDPLVWQLGSTSAGIPGFEAGVFTCGALVDLPAVADTYLEEDDQAANNGGADPLLTRPQPVGSINRALYRFDLTSLPAGAAVTSGTLYLTSRNSRNNHLANVHRVTTAWTEAANWTTPWASPGGDFDGTVLGTFVPNQTRQSIDVTTLVQDWLAGTFGNHGVILDPTGTDGGDAQWASRGDGTASRRPLLRVGYEYTSPGGCPATIQAPADQDTYIEEDNQAADNSTANALRTRPEPAGSINRSLYRFDLSAIPADATIDSALLTVTSKNSRSNHLANVYRVTTDWAETANWNTPWVTAGGDFDTGTLLGSFTPDQTQQQIDIATLVQQWVNGTTPNYGVVLSPTGTDNGDAEWFSREEGTESRRPFIEISYRSPTVDVVLPVTGDTYIEEDDQGANNGTSDPVLTRPQPAGQVNRALFQFETGGLPASATVVSATLNINSANSRSNHLANVRHMTSAWTESANWTTTDGAASWTTAGGDFAGSYGSLTPVGGDTFQQADVTSLVQDWADGTLAPYGVILDPSGSDGGDAQWNSREDGDATRHAFIDVQYTAAGSTIERTSTLTAGYSLVTAGDTFDLTLVLEATGDVTGVLPGSLGISGTNGVGATCVPTSPVTVPGVFDPQDVAAGSPATFVWSCTASAGATPGTLTFDVDASGSESFATAISNSVLVSPPLTLQVVVDNPLDPDATLIVNTATIASDLTTPASDTVLDPVVRGAIGDRIWLDTDGDGVQDIGEEGIANVALSIYSVGGDGVPGGGDDVLIGTATTDANGNYLFSGLAPGTYYIDVTDGSVPTGLVLAPGSFDAPSEPLATLPTYTVTASEVYLSADIGYTTPGDSAVVGDYVWSDADSDGVQDSGEPGIGGVSVLLIGPGLDGVFGTADDALEDTTTTAADGSYLFTGVAPGEYIVQLDTSNFAPGGALEGYSPTVGPQSQGSATSDPLSVAAGDVWVEADFGYFKAGLGSIGNLVWLDADGDGTFDVAESGLEGVSLDLVLDLNKDVVIDRDGADDIFGTADDEMVIATAVTGPDGSYSFNGLLLDDGSGEVQYLVVVSDTAGVLAGIAQMLGTPRVDGEGQEDPYSVELSPVVTLNVTADFGYGGRGTIGDRVWSDADGDGVEDPGEPGLAGLTVQLYEDTNGNGVLEFGAGFDQLVAETTTDAGGSYLFAGVEQGTYFVSILPQAPLVGYTLTTADDEPAVGDQIEVTLSDPDQSFLEADFGYQATGASVFPISGTVFDDSDADGVQEAGESGVAGVTLVLRDVAGGIVATTTTGADGSYLFPDLVDGDYTIQVTDDAGVLDGYTLTSGLDAIDVTVSGGPVTEVDFGYTRDPVAGAIGDQIWLDSDGDGAPGPGEPGLSGVAVELWEDSDGDGVLNKAVDTLIATTLTDADGEYLFTGLGTGFYFLDVDGTTLPETTPGDLVETTYPPGTEPSALIALSESESFRRGDFGFVPAFGTAVLGDRIWYDADGDGLQDPGEIGIEGVDVLLQGPSCTPTPCTVTTGPDGSWWATGLLPGEYIVTFDAATLPPGYDPTPTNNGGDATYTLTVAAGDVVASLDFGIDGGTTGSIGNQIWLDKDGDGIFEPLGDDGLPGTGDDEPGLEGVTISLVRDSDGDGVLDPGEPIVATTTTAIGGTYLFSGLPLDDGGGDGDADYLLDVTDIDGVLFSLNLTLGTPDLEDNSQADPYSVALSTGAPTSSTGDFGYAPSAPLGVIGNVVWHDLDGDGLYEPLGDDDQPGTVDDEPGIQGATVQLWRDDGDLVFEPFTGEDNLLRSTPTDGNGEYEFLGLPSGPYWVTVTDEAGGLVGFVKTLGPVPGSDNNSQLDPYRVTLASSNFTGDFGYWANPVNPVLSIGGTVFEDADNDATFDSGVEPVVAGATVNLFRDLDGDGLLDQGEPLIGTTPTNASGTYLFTNLPPGDYLVEVETTGTSVDSYLQTTQTGTRGLQPVTLVAADSTGNDFGFWDGGFTTTPVTLAFFEASGSGTVLFHWSTATEVGNLGFHLYALEDEGFRRLNDELIPSSAIDSLAPQDYEFEAWGVEGELFLLEDVDIFGEVRHHGPFRLNESAGARPSRGARIDWQGIRAARAHRSGAPADRGARGPASSPVLQPTLAEAPPTHRLSSSPSRQGLTSRSSGFNGVQLLVDRDGVYRVTHEELLAAGFDLTSLPSSLLTLSNRGQSVYLHVGGPRFFGPGSYVEFVGVALDSLYTRSNVYNLEVGTTRLDPPTDRDKGYNVDYGGRAPESYLETAKVEVQRSYHFASPTEDPWFDQRLLAISGPVEATFDFDLEDWAAGNRPVTLEVSLWGVTDFPAAPDHHVVLEVNGVPIAEDLFDGLRERRISAELPDGLLQPQGNTLRVLLPHDTGVKYDLVHYDHYTITYPRRFRARDGRLRFTARAPGFRVEALPSADVVVYRVTGDSAQKVIPVRITGVPGAYVATFPGSRTEATYHVSTVESLGKPRLEERQPGTNLLRGTPDLLILSHQDFLPGLQRFARARRSQGWRVKLVDVEAVYDHFGDGIFGPQAIHAYLRRAHPRMGFGYLLLVGGDTYDYHDYLELGSISFVPTPYTQTDSIVRFTPADALYSDLDADGSPDLAIGRWPVRTVDELQAVIDKTLEYDSLPYSGTAVLAADKRDLASNYSFRAASEELATLLGADWQVERAYMDELGLAGAKDLLLEQISNGVSLTSYFGHSGLTVWSFDRLFSATDANALDNAGRPTLVTQWGCWNTYHVSPHYDTLGHRLLLGPDRGAAAVFGATTLTEASSDLELARRLFAQLAEPGRTLGEALLEAKRQLATEEPDRLDVLLGSSLLGDPTLGVR